MRLNRETQRLYVRSMGKMLRVTAIWPTDAEANADMERHTNDAVVAVFGPHILLADKYDDGHDFDDRADKFLSSARR